MKNKLFQSGEICRLLQLPKQRFEYICLKLPIIPTVHADGTGTANKYDFSAIFSCLICECLSKWGYSFRQISPELNYLEKEESSLFDSSSKVSIDDATSHVIWKVEVPFSQSDIEVKGNKKQNSPLKIDRKPDFNIFYLPVPDITYRVVEGENKCLMGLEDNDVAVSETRLPKEKKRKKRSSLKSLDTVNDETNIYEIKRGLHYMKFSLNLSLLKYWLVSQL